MEHEFEVDPQREALEKEKEIREAEEHLLRPQETAQEYIEVSEKESSSTTDLREEARLLEPRNLGPEFEAEESLLNVAIPIGTSVEISTEKEKSTPERQELHKTPEAIVEKQPGGSYRPSWESSPDISKPHLVPAHVLQELDDHIAKWVAENDSRIQGRELTDRDFKILKGDAGEGRTYIDLLERYDRDRIMHQPRSEDLDRIRNPDFAVVSDKDPNKTVEVVDSKAWSLLRPKDAHGSLVSNDDYFRHLHEQPEAQSLINTSELQNVVEKYSSSPRLEPDGKVVLYFPEDVIRYAPQVKQKIEGWSGSEIAHGYTVEVRSMGVWERDLWNDVHNRLQT